MMMRLSLSRPPRLEAFSSLLLFEKWTPSERKTTDDEEEQRERDEARRDGAFKVKLFFRTRARLREREREREDPHTHTLSAGKKKRKIKNLLKKERIACLEKKKTMRKDAPRSRSSLVTLSVSPPLPAKP